MVSVLEPPALVEKFLYKKQNKIGKNSDFIEIKGVKGQVEADSPSASAKNVNDKLGFKCLHYSVTESSG